MKKMYYISSLFNCVTHSLTEKEFDKEIKKSVSFIEEIETKYDKGILKTLVIIDTLKRDNCVKF